MYSLDILWSTGKAMEGREQSYSPCPAVCGCKRGRGEDREVIFVEEDGLRTYVCVLLFWMWRSQVEKEICGLEWWWDKFECVCVCMWGVMCLCLMDEMCSCGLSPQILWSNRQSISTYWTRGFLHFHQSCALQRKRCVISVDTITTLMCFKSCSCLNVWNTFN